MATSTRRSGPVQEAFLRWRRKGMDDPAAGNLTALEMTARELGPVTEGWTPAQVATFLFLRAMAERWR